MQQKITPRQNIALFAIATGQGVSQAAEEAGVKRETVSRWLALPHVKEKLTELRSTIEQTAVSKAALQLSGLMYTSVNKLETLLNNDELSHSDKIRAIRTVFEYYPKLHDVAEIDDRLRKIEEMLNDQ
jgi:hypothetical protein